MITAYYIQCTLQDIHAESELCELTISFWHCNRLCSGFKQFYHSFLNSQASMQTIVDDALDITEKEGHAVRHVAVLDHKLAAKRSDVPWKEGRDIWWQDVMDALPSECSVEWVDAEAPLFKVCMPAFSGLQATFAFLRLNVQRAFYHLHVNCTMCTVHMSYSSMCKSSSCP